MKYSTETANKILKLIEAGNFSKHSAEANNVSESSFHKWRKKYPAFRASIQKAEAKRITALTKQISEHKSFQALSWLVERLDRKHFHLPTVANEEMQNRLDIIEEKLDKVLKDKDKK